MTPGFQSSSASSTSMKISSNVKETSTSSSPWYNDDITASWDPFPAQRNMNITASIRKKEGIPLQTPSEEREKSAHHRNTSRSSKTPSLGDLLGRQSVSHSRTSAMSLSGLDTSRQRSEYDTPSRSNRRDYDDVKSLGDLSKAKRRSKEEKKKSSSKKSSKKNNSREEIQLSKSMSDVPTLHKTQDFLYNPTTRDRDRDREFTKSTLSTIRSQRLLEDCKSMPGDMDRWGNRSIGDCRSVVSASLMETPEELARRRLKMQQKMALRRQSETLEKDPMGKSTSLGAFLSQNRADDSDEAAAATDDKDEESDDDDNETFFSMFQWSAAEGDTTTKKKSISGSKSVGGGRSISNGRNRGLSGSKSICASIGRSKSVSGARVSRYTGEVNTMVNPSMDSPAAPSWLSKNRKNSSLDVDHRYNTRTRAMSDGETLHKASRSERQEGRISRKSLVSGDPYQSGSHLGTSEHVDDITNSAQCNFMGDLTKSLRESSREERRQSRRESRATLEKAYASAADIAGIQRTAIDDYRTVANIQPTQRSHAKRADITRGEQESYDDDITVDRSTHSRQRSTNDSRSSHSRRKATEDTDNDTVSRSLHSRRKDETKEERKERKKREKERTTSRKDGRNGGDDDRRSHLSSTGDELRRSSSSKNNKTDGDDVVKAKKKKKESRRKSDLNEEGESRHRSKSAAVNRTEDSEECVSRRRSKSVATITSQKIRSTSKRRKSRKSKRESVATGIDASVADHKGTSAPLEPMHMSRTSAFYEDSDNDQSLTAPGAATISANKYMVNQILPTYGGNYDDDLEPSYDSQYDTNIEGELTDTGEVTVVHLSDTDNEDEISHVSQVEDGEMQRFHSSMSSEELDNVLLQFEPSEDGNIERINQSEQSRGSVLRIQNSDGSHIDSMIMGMPETSFNRVQSDFTRSSTSTMPYNNGSEYKIGLTLTPQTLGQSKSMKRLIKRTGNLFRREKSIGDDDTSPSTHQRDGNKMNDSCTLLQSGDLSETPKNRRSLLRRNRSGKGESPTDAMSSTESTPRNVVKSFKSPRHVTKARSKSLSRQKEHGLDLLDIEPASATATFHRKDSSRCRRRPSN